MNMNDLLRIIPLSCYDYFIVIEVPGGTQLDKEQSMLNQYPLIEVTIDDENRRIIIEPDSI